VENCTIDNVKEKMSQMARDIRILEWDDMRQQINPAKKAQLMQMRKEYSDLQKQVTDTAQA
jgi:hypothetical protein